MKDSVSVFVSIELQK